MAKAIEVLMNEHRLIERVAASLEAYACGLPPGAGPERPRVAEFAGFFQRYADAFHHGKEEDLLFKAMVDRGFPLNGGPLAVMLHEHEVGRAHVRALAAIGEASGAAAAEEAEAFVRHSTSFGPMLRAHIQKEDGILYPMALRVLPPSELERLADQYAAFEANAIQAGTVEELLSLGERLVATHPFDPAVLEMAMGGCMAHG